MREKCGEWERVKCRSKLVNGISVVTTSTFPLGQGTVGNSVHSSYFTNKHWPHPKFCWNNCMYLADTLCKLQLCSSDSSRCLFKTRLGACQLFGMYTTFPGQLLFPPQAYKSPSYQPQHQHQNSTLEIHPDLMGRAYQSVISTSIFWAYKFWCQSHKLILM